MLFKKISTLLVSSVLLMAMATSASAADPQSSPSVEEGHDNTQKFYLTTDPIKNQALIKSYGSYSLNDRIDYFVNSSTYANSDYTLLNSYPTEKNTDYAKFYGVVRYYKANNAGKHALYILEQDSTISGVTKDGKSSAISGLTWNSWYESTGGSISLNKYSPMGTVEQPSTNSYNWSINPNVMGNSLGSFGGTFQLTKGRLIGSPSTASFVETWKGDPVVHPANVAQQGASSWFVENGNGPGLAFWWNWSWDYSTGY